MVTKCANPLCGAPFRYFREGKLFLVDVSRQMTNASGEESAQRTKRNPEYFWLCEQCSSTMAIDVDSNGRVTVRSVSSASVGASCRGNDEAAKVLQ
jgi:hypothetical protein